MSYFKTGTPESQGIESSAISEFLETMDRKGLEIHRFMMIRNDICVAKGCYSPYQEEDLHPLYSFTKSFTSTAIGFAVQEGILSLDDRLVDIFPEEVPELDEIRLEDGSIPKTAYPSENSADTLEEMMGNLKAITIHHLLCMSCGHEIEIEGRKEGWLHAFLRQPVLHKPGTFFKYNTAGTNLLAGILKKKTGKDMTEFLRPRLFEPLGIDKYFCYSLPGDFSVQAGGFGMKLSLESMAKFTQFMLHDGYWEGKPILPGWYRKMSRKHMETAGDSEGHVKDWGMGYGYQCWMGTYPGSFRADGAFGQFGLAFPDLNLSVIINASTEQTQQIIDGVNEILVPGCKSEPIPVEGVSRDQHIVRKKLKLLRIPALTSCLNPMIEDSLEGTIFRPDGISSDLEHLIGGSGLMPINNGIYPEKKQITGMSFSFDQNSVIWRVTEQPVEGAGEEHTYEILASRTHGWERRYSEALDAEYAATARWRSRCCLEMEIRRMDALSGSQILFRFDQDTLRLEIDETLITNGGLGMTVRKTPEFQA